MGLSSVKTLSGWVCVCAVGMCLSSFPIFKQSYSKMLGLSSLREKQKQHHCYFIRKYIFELRKTMSNKRSLKNQNLPKKTWNVHKSVLKKFKTLTVSPNYISLYTCSVSIESWWGALRIIKKRRCLPLHKEIKQVIKHPMIQNMYFKMADTSMPLYCTSDQPG